MKRQAKRNLSCPFAEANGKENSTLPEQKSSSNCDIQQGDPTNESSCISFFKAEKSKKQGVASFFREILVFLSFFCGMAGSGKFWVLGRFVGWCICGFGDFGRFGKRSETA